MIDLLVVGELIEAAGERNQLQHRDGTGHGIRARLSHHAGDEDPAAVDLFHDDRHARLLDELGRFRANAIAKLFGRQTRSDHVVDEGQGDAAVGPHDDVGRHLFVAPEHHVQHVVGANGVAGRNLERRGGRRRRRQGRDRRHKGRWLHLGGRLHRGRADERERHDECVPYGAKIPDSLIPHCRYSLNGSWQSCLRRKFRNRL